MEAYNGIKTMTRKRIVSELKSTDNTDIDYSKEGKEDLERLLAVRRGIRIPFRYRTADHLAISRALRQDIGRKLTGDRLRVFRELDRTGDPRGLALQARWLRKRDITEALDNISHEENPDLNIKFTGFERLGIGNTFIIYPKREPDIETSDSRVKKGWRER